ncbi:MAG: hypothetical protein RLZZ584_2463 [Pseudomonadota bacterium]|jgi:alpha-ketoglutarate-dependent taurine dioxygenase
MHDMSVIDLPRLASPFDLRDRDSYQRWRAWKLAHAPRAAEDLLVEVGDPARLSGAERAALLTCIARCNVAVYRLRGRPGGDAAAGVAKQQASVQALGAQLGLHRLDANWLAEEDGISQITVKAAEGDARAGDGAAFIPYTDRAIRWHTDGYYHPRERRIHAMILHAVRPAQEGGVNRLLDHELAYIALRDEEPALVRALMHPQAMTIPARLGAAGEARAAQSGPVFSVTPGVDGRPALHLRYTARTRSIVWREDPLTQAAAARLLALLDAPACAGRVTLRLDAGMGIVGHNLLHDRSAFRDDPAAPRLLLRARYLDRCSPVPDQDNTAKDMPWRNG